MIFRLAQKFYRKFSYFKYARIDIFTMIIVSAMYLRFFLLGFGILFSSPYLLPSGSIRRRYLTVTELWIS